MAPERAKRGVIRQALAAEDQSVNASLYILLRAVDRFQATCGRFPWRPPRVRSLALLDRHGLVVSISRLAGMRTALASCSICWMLAKACTLPCERMGQCFDRVQPVSTQVDLGQGGGSCPLCLAEQWTCPRLRFGTVQLCMRLHGPF